MDSLLDNLDISHATWQGKWSNDTPFQHIDPSLDASKSSNNISLCKIFNSLPSPRPNPKVIHDEYIKEAMQSILKGNIQGIVSETKIYPYQCRTAAMMLQREAQMTYLLDPRLQKIKDQAGNDFYLDRVVNVCHREPRFYENPPGGICAESMGSGKTLICLALILSTKHLSSQIPVKYSVGSTPIRSTTGSLLDMAASAIGRFGFPWEFLLRKIESEQGTEFSQIRQALHRGRGYYWDTVDQPQGNTGKPAKEPRKIWLTNATVVVVHSRLIRQWVLEIEKHTTGLNYLVMDDLAAPLPAVEELLKYDIILLSKDRFNKDAELHHTPLKDLRFKRLITDECHGFGDPKGASTDGVMSVDFLHLDARWIVSGTPTKCPYGGDADSSVNHGFPDLSLSPDTFTNQQKLLIEQERMDLKRLGRILSLYLSARPWAKSTAQNDQASWKSLIIDPRYNRSIGGNANLIKSSLKGIMIRHRTEDINEQLHLPPLHKNIVYLHGCFQNKLSLNLFSMMIVINAVESERKGIDYLFHPKSRGALQILVSNLREASFTWSGFTTAMIEDSLEIARKLLEKVNLNSNDKKLLHKAIQVGNLALSNAIFTMVSRTHEMPMYIRSCLHEDTRYAWALDNHDENPTLMGARQLMYAKEFFELHENNNKLLQRNFRPSENGTKKKTVSEDSSESGNVQSVRPNSMDHIPDSVPPVSTQRMDDKMWKTSTIASTGSSKLSYIMDQVFVHHNLEKIIIFYETENVGHYIRESLRCMDIQYLICSEGDSVSECSICIVKFNTLTEFRVMLMDVHQAAFCLDMIAASRIYFVNPVLSPQIEAQAIKRAHCIGQLRPVYVETLALRGTIDEVILTRRGITTDQTHVDLNNVLDDPRLYDWIQNIPFHKFPDGKIEGPCQLSPLMNTHLPFAKININRDDIDSKLRKWKGGKSIRSGLTNNISQCVSSVATALDTLDFSDLMRHLGPETQLRIFQHYRRGLHERKGNETLGEVDNSMEDCVIRYNLMDMGSNNSTSDDIIHIDPDLMARFKSARNKHPSFRKNKRPPLPSRAGTEVKITSKPRLQRASSLSLRSTVTQIERQQVAPPTMTIESENEVGKNLGVADRELDQMVAVTAKDAEVSELAKAAEEAEGSTLTMAVLQAIHAEYEADPDHGNLYDE